MSRLTRDGTAEPVSRYQIIRRERGQGNTYFPCSADREQDWQPYPVDLYIHTYMLGIHFPQDKRPKWRTFPFPSPGIDKKNDGNMTRFPRNSHFSAISGDGLAPSNIQDLFPVLSRPGNFFNFRSRPGSITFGENDFHPIPRPFRFLSFFPCSADHE